MFTTNYKTQGSKSLALETRLDELDLRLVEILQNDSSMPAVQIARDLQVTEGTVRNRIRRLRRLGVIRKFTVVVDPTALGQNMVAFVLVNAAPGRLSEVAKRLSSLDIVSGVYETHTYADLLLKLRVKNSSDLADVVANRIKTVSGVAGTQVVSVLNIWKDM